LIFSIHLQRRDHRADPPAQFIAYNKMNSVVAWPYLHDTFQSETLLANVSGDFFFWVKINFLVLDRQSAERSYFSAIFPFDCQ
jgi:hypothetical protein